MGKATGGLVQPQFGENCKANAQGNRTICNFAKLPTVICYAPKTLLNSNKTKYDENFT